MKTKLTKHAEIRKKQRGFSDFSIEIIKKLGRDVDAPGNATKLYFGNKEYQEAISELKKVIQLMDKVKNGTLIVSGKNILTMYK